MFSAAVSTMMNSIGFSPLNIVAGFICDSAMHAAVASTTAMYDTQPFDWNSATMYSTTSISFVRASSRWTIVSPGKYWPRVMSFSMCPPPFSSSSAAFSCS